MTDEQIPTPGGPTDQPPGRLRGLLRRPWAAVAAAAAGLAVGVAATVAAVAVSADGPATPRHTGAAIPASTAKPGPHPGPSLSLTDEPPRVESCPPATVVVEDAKALEQALRSAKPGSIIRLRDGVYNGKFVANISGTAGQPIFLCGGPGAILDAGSATGGYVLHLDGANYWSVVGFSVRNGQKGVVADGVQHALIRGLTVENIGDEAIHLRKFSSDNVVEANTVRKTGLRRDTFGEGIYIGTAQSNWCTITDCKPDLSDRNIIRDNRISETTAEAIDIKEGTTGGMVIRNTFEGSQESGSHNDSWVDVKGNGWLIKANTGRNAKVDGFQTHEVVNGWGSGNVFESNVAEVNGPGFGFSLTPVNGNVVRCDNRVTGALKGFANVACT